MCEKDKTDANKCLNIMRCLKTQIKLEHKSAC